MPAEGYKDRFEAEASWFAATLNAVLSGHSAVGGFPSEEQAAVVDGEEDDVQHQRPPVVSRARMKEHQASMGAVGAETPADDGKIASD